MALKAGQVLTSHMLLGLWIIFEGVFYVLFMVAFNLATNGQLHSLLGGLHGLLRLLPGLLGHQHGA